MSNEIITIKEKCPICFEQYTTNIVFLGCAHCICGICLEKASQREGSYKYIKCPLCRHISYLQYYAPEPLVEIVENNNENNRQEIQQRFVNFCFCPNNKRCIYILLIILMTLVVMGVIIYYLVSYLP